MVLSTRAQILLVDLSCREGGGDFRVDNLWLDAQALIIISLWCQADCLGVNPPRFWVGFTYISVRIIGDTLVLVPWSTTKLCRLTIYDC